MLPLRLDVTDRAAAFAAVERAHDHFGRLDVVVNNAGCGQYGFVEELSETELRAQMDINFFGAVWITQAALPYLRAQRGGHLIQVSSIGGVTAFPNLAGYHASKWALEGFRSRWRRRWRRSASTSRSSNPAASAPTGSAPRSRRTGCRPTPRSTRSSSAPAPAG